MTAHYHPNDPDNPGRCAATVRLIERAEADAATIRAALVACAATVRGVCVGKSWAEHWWPVHGYDLSSTLDMLADMTPAADWTAEPPCGLDAEMREDAEAARADAMYDDREGA